VPSIKDLGGLFHAVILLLSSSSSVLLKLFLNITFHPQFPLFDFASAF
jgi:hypothetical protein